MMVATTAQTSCSYAGTTSFAAQPGWSATITDVAAPDVLPITAIHAGPDGCVTFHGKGTVEQGGRWMELGFTPVGELQGQFPRFSSTLVENCYFSINSLRPPMPSE